MKVDALKRKEDIKVKNKKISFSVFTKPWKQDIY